MELLTELKTEASRLRHLLLELSRATQLLEKSEVGCCGISLSQCHLLLEVSRREGEGETSLSDLAALLELDLSTVSRVADGLVRQNLLKREIDSQDRRRSILTLTGGGKELVENINRNMRAYTQEILKQIPPEKRSAVLESLGLLVEAIQKIKGGCCRE
ncbi:MAG: MarR family transcriptional regulator [Bacillota bacterium]